MSGIYIPGMEMPTNCEDCIFCDGDACLMHKPNEYRSWTEEYKNCPLVPVPKHGRPIDADEADNRYVADFTELNDFQCGWNAAMKRVCDDAPTIIPASPADKEGER